MWHLHGPGFKDQVQSFVEPQEEGTNGSSSISLVDPHTDSISENPSSCARIAATYSLPSLSVSGNEPAVLVHVEPTGSITMSDRSVTEHVESLTEPPPTIAEPLFTVDEVEQQIRQQILQEQQQQEEEEARLRRSKPHQQGQATPETSSEESPIIGIHGVTGNTSSCLLTLVLVLAVSVGVVIAFLYINNQESPTPFPSLAPSSSAPSASPLSVLSVVDRAMDILEYFRSVQLSDYIIADDPDSTSLYNQTFVWLIRYDKLRLTSADEYRLIQRALLVMQFIYQSVIPFEEFGLSEQHECNLSFVWTCDHDKIVREMRLPGFDHEGTLTADFGLLTSLTLLKITGFNGTGTSIPSTLGLLTKLTELSMNNNRASGKIPPQLGNLGELAALHLHDNLFAGTIPTELANLANINEADFSNNPRLYGSMPFCDDSARVIPTKLLADCNIDCPCCSSCTTTRAGNITTIIQDALLSDVLVMYDRESKSLYNQTLVWLIDEELQLPSTDKYRLIQRYCLLLFLFSTEGTTWDQLIPRDECSDPFFEDWVGCENGIVRELRFFEAYLNGSLPVDIGLLTSLTSLHIQDINARGSSIPTLLGALTSLIDLRIIRSGLSGTIPSELGALTRLKVLDLHGNDLVGTVPESLTFLINLDNATFSGNPRMSGQMPFCETSATAPSLLVADCDIIDCACCTKCCRATMSSTLSPIACVEQQNTPGPTPQSLLTRADDITTFLQDAFPSETVIAYDPESPSPYNETLVWIIDHDKLKLWPSDGYKLVQRYSLMFYLFYQVNFPWTTYNVGDECQDPLLRPFWQCEDGIVANLTFFELDLAGTLPAEVALLTALTTLHIEGNIGDGSIPSTLGLLTNLGQLRLGRNGFKGTIPSELGDLTKLSILDLSGNRLTGTIPATLTNLPNLEVGHFFWNKLVGSIPFCDFSTTSTPPPARLVVNCETNCTCCSSCCPMLPTSDGVPPAPDSCIEPQK